MLCSFVPELGSDSFISPRIGIGTAWAKKERSMKSSHVVPIFSGPFSEQSTARFLDKIPRVFWTFREICQNSIYCMSMSEHEHLIFLNKLIFVLDPQFHPTFWHFRPDLIRNFGFRISDFGFMIYKSDGPAFFFYSLSLLILLSHVPPDTWRAWLAACLEASVLHEQIRLKIITWAF